MTGVMDSTSSQTHNLNAVSQLPPESPRNIQGPVSNRLHFWGTTGYVVPRPTYIIQPVHSRLIPPPDHVKVSVSVSLQWHRQIPDADHRSFPDTKNGASPDLQANGPQVSIVSFNLGDPGGQEREVKKGNKKTERKEKKP